MTSEEAGQSRFAWCRGQTQEASLVPMQFKAGYSSPRVYQGPAVGERTEEGSGFPLYYSQISVKQYSGSNTGHRPATRAGTDHINSSSQPSFPLWRLL